MSNESESQKPNYWPGILVAILATLIFAFQDAITKTLVSSYPITFIVMVRYWVFLAVGMLIAKQSKGGFRKNSKTGHIYLQILRGVLLLAELILIGLAFRHMGLAETTALFQAYPLFGTLLAILILKEAVGWRRITALIIGFLGILIMIRPGSGVFSFGAIFALSGSFCFALYATITRLVGDRDSAITSFFYIGLVGAIITTGCIYYFWVDMDPHHVWLLVLLCLMSVSGHFAMIKALTMAPVSIIQPFNYLQLVWSIFVGLIVFNDFPDKWTLIGAAIVVGSGLFVFYREQVRQPKLKLEDAQ
ncbi:DMT family transporter [Bartonella sp. HY329]|uniref:DMT family transporter n=1 Tax=unclassified Bartonella TaxID=2645622 RepID=UPI0021C7D319|nr:MULTISPECIES: DMT family transporter [unclassified Bartonella]UXM94609.1 DMT family transporter [Bartonella sp. HY329]UXN08932.1 DMT family transporter [Bartonella sp. HY328]